MTVKRILFLPENDSPTTHNENWHGDFSQEYLIKIYVTNLLGLNHIDDIKRKTIFVGNKNDHDCNIEILYRDDKDLTSNKHITFMKGPICIVCFHECDSFDDYTYDYVDFDKYLTLEVIIKILHIEKRIEINNTLLIKKTQQLWNEHEELLQAGSSLDIEKRIEINTTLYININKQKQQLLNKHLELLLTERFRNT